MKKLLSIMLVLLMALSVFACNGTTPAQPDEPEKPVEQPTEAPAEQPTEAPVEPEPEATVNYEGLALQLKNKTGLTIKALYISEKGEGLYAKKLNSVVEEGWKDKDADEENYEQFIYIVREAGREMEVTVVFEDETTVVWDVGTLAMYDELSLKKGTDPANWEHEPVKDEDKPACDLIAALGKTSDNVYPGYELIPVELKNKTGKGIKELYFYEEGGDPKAYNNMIDYLYTPEGEKMDVLMSGKAKEGGMYLFKCFIRPHAENYMIDVVFDDGATITYPIEGWFKPDANGNLPNEISLKNAEDPDDIKVQYDDGVPEPIDYLAESLAKGYVVDQWYPTYATVEVDAETVEALRAAMAMIPVPASEEPAEPAEPIVGDDPSTWAPVFVPAEGYVQLALQLKNKTGKDIKELYIYPVGEEIGNNVTVEPLPDKETDGEGYERFILLFREEAKLGAMEIKVVYGDGEEAVWKLTDELKSYDKLSMDGGTQPDAEGAEWKHKASKEEDYPEFEAVLATAIPDDGWYPKA